MPVSSEFREMHDSFLNEEVLVDEKRVSAPLLVIDEGYDLRSDYRRPSKLLLDSVRRTSANRWELYSEVVQQRRL